MDFNRNVITAGVYVNSVPILVTRRNEEYITPIYLCYSHDEPRPPSETKALLLLRPWLREAYQDLFR